MGTEAKKSVRFYPGLDILLLREVLAVQPTTKAAWDSVHSHVNETLKERNVYVTLRACRDRMRHLQEAHRKDEMSSLRASGTEEEYDERVQLLTELADVDEERKTEAKKTDVKELQGEDIRAAAMETLAETRKAKNDKSGELTTPRKKQRTSHQATEHYMAYLQDKLELERERFELEKREREARLEKDRDMLKIMMAVLKKES